MASYGLLKIIPSVRRLSEDYVIIPEIRIQQINKQNDI